VTRDAECNTGKVFYEKSGVSGSPEKMHVDMLHTISPEYFRKVERIPCAQLWINLRAISLLLLSHKFLRPGALAFGALHQ